MKRAMCGRYSFSKAKSLKNRYHVVNDYAFDAAYNAAPSQILPVIVETEGTRRVMGMKWGLVPQWSKEPTVKFSTINARAETVAKSAVYKIPFYKQRCLIPADGFYEWKKLEGGKHKIPYYVYLPREPIISFAGLYDQWRDAEGKVFPSFTIITTTPNELMKPIHDRMPVILSRYMEATWLDPATTEPETLQKLLRPYEANAMAAYQVSPLVNSPRNNGPELIQPVRQE